MFDRKIFFDTIRPLGLTDQNVMGFDRCLDYAADRQYEINELAYTLATAFWESARTMHPVKEAYWLSEEWRRKNLRYYPWYGRGLVQTTWEENYRKVGEMIGMDLIANPDLLLDFPAALPALFLGMEKGIYTGVGTGDFIDDDVGDTDDDDYKEFVAARKIVNGKDKAKEIADIAMVIRKGLKMGGWAPGVEPAPVPPPPDIEPPPDDTEEYEEPMTTQTRVVLIGICIVIVAVVVWNFLH